MPNFANGLVVPIVKELEKRFWMVEEAERYEARAARQRGVTKGPGENGGGGITFRPGVESQAPNTAEAPERSLRLPRLGYGSRSAQVPGGVTPAQWLTTLTGESPTSSIPTLAAGVVRRVDKA